MLVPPRPLPLVDRLYLLIRYHAEPTELRHLKQLGLTREDIERTLDRHKPVHLREDPEPGPAR